MKNKTGPVHKSKGIFQRLASLKISFKFSLAAGLFLIILAAETIISYAALTVVLESNNAILSNAEMQRLALGINRNWESIKRLRRSYLAQTGYIGADQAYEEYALPAGVKITEVIRDSATLIRLVSSPNAGENLNAHVTDLKTYLSTVSDYANTFEAATELEFQIHGQDSGLYTQLDRDASRLQAKLETGENPELLLAPFYRMRFYEREYLSNPQVGSETPVFQTLSGLRQAIAGHSMPDADKDASLSALADYELTAQTLFDSIAQLQEKRQWLDDMDESIEPVLVALMAAVDTEAGQARAQIEATRLATLRRLGLVTIFGLILAGSIAIYMHKSVTRKIVQLTRVTHQFRDGNLDARAHIESSDEIGELATTFNEMAESVQSLNLELREQAIRDSLTGLLNRRYFDETLPRELARAARTGKPVTLVMIDMDELKSINDEFGHPAGDRILIELGRVLSSNTRLGDVACRYGGDEFTILLPGATLEDGIQRAEIWRQKFRDITIRYKAMSVNTTLSAGVVEWVRGETPADLVARVDATLYTAKNAGRNRITGPDSFLPSISNN